MSVGLVRSETASDLRTLAATGASSYTRRTLTAVTAGALGFLGALLGVVGGYIGMIGWLRSNSLNGGIAALGNIPGRGPPPHPPRHAGVRGDRRLAVRGPRARRRWRTRRSSERIAEMGQARTLSVPGVKRARRLAVSPGGHWFRLATVLREWRRQLPWTCGALDVPMPLRCA